MRRLDACRNRLLRTLAKHLDRIEQPEITADAKPSRQIVYYGKPFSYYYSVIEKPKSSLTYKSPSSGSGL